jgi:hypothetical protein
VGVGVVDTVGDDAKVDESVIKCTSNNAKGRWKHGGSGMIRCEMIRDTRCEIRINMDA